MTTLFHMNFSFKWLSIWGHQADTPNAAIHHGAILVHNIDTTILKTGSEWTHFQPRSLCLRQAHFTGYIYMHEMHRESQIRIHGGRPQCSKQSNNISYNQFSVFLANISTKYFSFHQYSVETLANKGRKLILR